MSTALQPRFGNDNDTSKPQGDDKPSDAVKLDITDGDSFATDKSGEKLQPLIDIDTISIGPANLPAYDLTTPENNLQLSRMARRLRTIPLGAEKHHKQLGDLATKINSDYEPPREITPEDVDNYICEAMPLIDSQPVAPEIKEFMDTLPASLWVQPLPEKPASEKSPFGCSLSSWLGIDR